jgi:SM-20-related protein
MNPLLDIESLRSAKPETDPIPFLVTPRFLKPAALEAVSRDFPKVSEPRNHGVKGLDYGPSFEKLLDELADPEWIRLLGEKLGVPDLADLPYNTTIRTYCEASDGHIHTDHWSKVVTVLIYPNREWTAEGGRLRILRSKTDLEDFVTEVTPSDGTMLAFRRTPRSFHGHHRHVGPRQLIQISWLRSNPIARVWQGLARYATHLSKRTGLHSDD